MSSKFLTNVAVLGVFCFGGIGSLYGLDRFMQGVKADRARLVRNACNAVSRLAPAQVRDGMATNIGGDRVAVDSMCWVKGTDGRWRQISDIFGPDVDVYPIGLRDTYYDLLPDFM